MVVNAADWAEQVAVYPLIQGEARWAVENLVAYARELEKKNEVLTATLMKASKRLMQERLRRLALEHPFAGADVRRVSGAVECENCGHQLYDHPVDPVRPDLTVACNLERVKL